MCAYAAAASLVVEGEYACMRMRRGFPIMRGEYACLGMYSQLPSSWRGRTFVRIHIRGFLCDGGKNANVYAFVASLVVGEVDALGMPSRVNAPWLP